MALLEASENNGKALKKQICKSEDWKSKMCIVPRFQEKL